ncbi:hypothetical protein U1Q18_051349 [Sarracenia purpurea var. burkii]
MAASWMDEYEITQEIITTPDSQGEETEEERDIQDQDQPEPEAGKKRLKWRKRKFQPILHDFDDTNSGFDYKFCEISDDCTILDYFECFVTPELASKIAFETNRKLTNTTSPAALQSTSADSFFMHLCDDKWSTMYSRLTIGRNVWNSWILAVKCNFVEPSLSSPNTPTTSTSFTTAAIRTVSADANVLKSLEVDANSESGGLFPEVS